MTVEEREIFRNLKCLFDLREFICNYYKIVDTTHISKEGGFYSLNFDENDTMERKGEESINVISALLVDSLINKQIHISVNDTGNVSSKSDMRLSDGSYLEMKRIPIGTKAYDKDRTKKYRNISPNNMKIEDSFDFIKDKVNEYAPKNLRNKQKANYIGFYFAVSNIDLYNSSIENLYDRLYSELKGTLNVFDDVFFIFNKINMYDSGSDEKRGSTICLSLKTGRFNSLTFNTPLVREQCINANIDENYSDDAILSDDRENYIIFNITNIDGVFHLMNSLVNGVCFDDDFKCYGYGNLACSVYVLSNFKRDKRHIGGVQTLGETGFRETGEDVILPFIVG